VNPIKKISFFILCGFKLNEQIQSLLKLLIINTPLLIKQLTSQYKKNTYQSTQDNTLKLLLASAHLGLHELVSSILVGKIPALKIINILKNAIIFCIFINMLILRILDR